MAKQDGVAIIGAGHVGATTGYALMLRALFRDILLIDNNVELAEAEAADLRDANALARPARIWAGNYADAATARIAVLTAGAATHGDESGLSVASRSSEIVTQCTAALIDAGFDGILLVAANPVDLMTLAALRASGLPPPRVIGTGTLLDTSRLRQAVADRLDVAPASVHGYILGEHGDSEVAAFSTVSGRRSDRRVRADRSFFRSHGDCRRGAESGVRNRFRQGLHLVRDCDRNGEDLRGDRS